MSFGLKAKSPKQSWSGHKIFLIFLLYHQKQTSPSLLAKEGERLLPMEISTFPTVSVLPPPFSFLVSSLQFLILIIPFFHLSA